MGALGSQRRGGGRLGSGHCPGILGPTIAIGLLALRANSLISREVLPRVRETVCGCCWYRPDSSGVVRVLGTA